MGAYLICKSCNKAYYTIYKIEQKILRAIEIDLPGSELDRGYTIF